MIFPSLYMLKWLLLVKGSLAIISSTYNFLEILSLTKSTVKMITYPFKTKDKKE